MSKSGNVPFLSVVVITYNDGTVLGRALDSILTQDYPKDRYEVIVVNDGSKDNTDEVMKHYPIVHYVKQENMGQATARNAGLKVAKGDVYVGFDSDCMARPGWLAEIAKGYQLDHIAGIGGVMVPMDDVHLKGLATHYMEATGSGTTRGADESGLGFLPPILRRLAVYLLGGLSVRPKKESETAYTEVEELYGANASFPMDVLKRVGGWDPTATAPVIGGIEDRDLSVRIRKAYPDRHFYAMRQAMLMHDPTISLHTYMLRSYRRGPFNYRFHVENGLTPPIFPWPPFIFIVWLAALLLAPLTAFPLLLLVLPQLCYFWWIQRAIVERKALYLLFPYFQLTEETFVLLGLIKGFVVHNKRKHEAN